jgi:glycoside/pentoside/hexuronide:cation symporter, GPH family
MGTALASFVAGALIVFTMFDETQVIKVDKIQGSVRELRSEVKSWTGDQALAGNSAGLLEKVNKQSAEALNESKDYIIFLERELQKNKDQLNPGTIENQSMREEMLSNTLSATKENIAEIDQLRSHTGNLVSQTLDSISNFITQEAIPLILQTRLEKARMNSFELMLHLETKALETKKSREHYDVLMQNVNDVNARLTDISTSLPLESFDKELATIEGEIVSLTNQSPYTLLMMRVVEIGLPLILSLFSIFFVLRYSLTEKRSHEIKDLLKKRNKELS